MNSSLLSMYGNSTQFWVFPLQFSVLFIFNLLHLLHKCVWSKSCISFSHFGSRCIVIFSNKLYVRSNLSNFFLKINQWVNWFYLIIKEKQFFTIFMLATAEMSYTLQVVTVRSPTWSTTWCTWSCTSTTWCPPPDPSTRSTSGGRSISPLSNL